MKWTHTGNNVCPYLKALVDFFNTNNAMKQWFYMWIPILFVLLHTHENAHMRMCTS